MHYKMIYDTETTRDLNKQLQKQNDIIEELRKSNELKSFEIAELKRKLNE